MYPPNTKLRTISPFARTEDKGHVLQSSLRCAGFEDHALTVTLALADLVRSAALDAVIVTVFASAEPGAT
jgi:hypothetical protein